MATSAARCAAPLGMCPGFVWHRHANLPAGWPRACARTVTWYMRAGRHGPVHTHPPISPRPYTCTASCVRALHPRCVPAQERNACELAHICWTRTCNTRVRRSYTVPEGSLTLRVESGDDRVTAAKWDAVLHVSASWDPFALVEQGACHVADELGGARASLPPQGPRRPCCNAQQGACHCAHTLCHSGTAEGSCD